ncbi:MAG: ComF family protein [Coriobacteriia bacterium]|nr:ComF family protein [Coriobacteriia bacterium]
MRILESLAELVFPTRCAGCELPGELLCRACRESLPLIDLTGACPRCGAPWGRLVCTECWDREWKFEAALSLGEFEAPLARAVVLHKDAGERRLASTLGTLLAEKIGAEWPAWPGGIAFVPATREALRRRGFDHGRAIAAAVAAGLEVPLVPALIRTRALDQRLLGRDARKANAAGTFAVTASVVGRVLLVDDVFTTGATLDDAARALLEGGAAAVRVASVARAW